MSIIDTLITNRTQADVDALLALYAKPRATWTALDLDLFLNGDMNLLHCWDGPLECQDGYFRASGPTGMLGAYNASDINRVLDALDYLADRVAQFGYQKPTVKRPAAGYYSIGDRPSVSELAEYLANVWRIRAVLELPVSVPAVPEDISQRITIEDANNVERILTAIETLLNRISLSWFHSGEIYSGEV